MLCNIGFHNSWALLLCFFLCYTCASSAGKVAITELAL